MEKPNFHRINLNKKERKIWNFAEFYEKPMIKQHQWLTRYNKANRHLFASFCGVSLNQKGFKRYAWRVYESETHRRSIFAMILSLLLRKSFMSLFFLLFLIFPSDSSDRIITDFALSFSYHYSFIPLLSPQLMRRTSLCEILFLRTFSRFSITHISNAGT